MGPIYPKAHSFFPFYDFKVIWDQRLTKTTNTEDRFQ